MEAGHHQRQRGWIAKGYPDVSNRGDLWDVGLEGSGGDSGCKGGNWKKAGVVFDQYKVWEEKGVLMPAQKNDRRDKVRLAYLNGDGLADFLAVADDGSIRWWKNMGSKGASIRFATLTSSGLDDVVAIDCTRRARA